MSEKFVSDAVSAIKAAVLKAQANVLHRANGTLLSMYYGIGRYVSAHSRKGTWGTGAIAAISDQLQKEMPGLRGFGERNIKNMRTFYEFWAPIIERQPTAAELDNVAIAPLDANRQLLAADFDLETFMSIGFSHHVEILSKAKTFEECAYYIQAAVSGKWSKYELRSHLKADDYNHVGKLPNNFAEAIQPRKSAISAIRAFRDEYVLDFLNVDDIDASSFDDVDERVLEKAIVANIKKFIMTFGRDFAFLGNQYRMEVAGHEQFIDLLFFNRELNCLVAVELKHGEFKPAYLGQMHLYLQLLEDQYKKAHENPPIGIILCKSADKTFVEYAVRDFDKPMGVATYKTAAEMPENLKRALPSIEELRQQLIDSDGDE